MLVASLELPSRVLSSFFEALLLSCLVVSVSFNNLIGSIFPPNGFDVSSFRPLRQT